MMGALFNTLVGVLHQEISPCREIVECREEFFYGAKFKIDSGPDNLVPTSDCYTVFFTVININVLCDFMLVFATNRCTFVISIDQVKIWTC